MFRAISLVFFLALFSSCATTAKDLPPYDLVLLATPIVAEPIVPNAVFDAFEGTEPEELNSMRAVVQLKVLDELKGEYTRWKVGGPSRLEQAKEAAKNSNFLKMITLDFKNPNEEVMKEWITVAVVDPFETFGIRNWDHPESGKYKLYLQTVPDQKDTFFMVAARKR